MSIKAKDRITKSLIYIAAGLMGAILITILGYILIKGLPGISLHFLTSDYENKTTYVTTYFYADNEDNGQAGYIGNLDASLSWDAAKEEVVITSIGTGSPLTKALDGSGNAYVIKKGDAIEKAGDINVKEELSENKSGTEIVSEIETAMETNTDGYMKLKVQREGGGILPMLVTTLYLILLSILIAGPIGVFAAIYLNEYAKPGKMTRFIQFAIENLAGIPSIIYGLFGSLFFVQVLKMRYSILAGACTMSIMLLPIIISTTKETLKSIPMTYRESSLGLGATKFQTIRKIVLPNAISGILVAILLSVGRIVGESAALLLTAGTVAQIPSALTGSGAAGATLTIKAYTLMKEQNDLTTACAIGIVLLAVIILLNLSIKLIARKLKRG